MNQARRKPVGADGAEIRVALRRIRVREKSVIEDVKETGFNPEFRPLTQFCVFGDGEVPILNPRTTDMSHARISEGVLRGAVKHPVSNHCSTALGVDTEVQVMFARLEPELLFSWLLATVILRG